MRTALAAAPIAAATVLLLTACSGAGPKGVGTGPVKVTATPTIAAVADRTLPIEAYLLNGQQTAVIDNAVGILETSCMARFGFDYHPKPVDPNSPVTQLARRYGSTDASVVASLGYHSPQTFNVTKSAGPTLTDQERHVLLGAPPTPGPGPSAAPAPAPAQSVNGQPVPQGGCNGEATAKVNPAPDRAAAELADQINLGDFQRSLTDPQVTAVFAAWSACMKSKGYTYATPVNAINDPAWATDAPTKTEIDTATADLDCKTRNNVVGVWYAVESAMENHDIAAKTGTLQKLKDGYQAALKRAAQISTGGGA
ncbi:hypothetical protein [Kitasatospora viridis]|uniref:PknH-like protein n=1 Tax=Kitasatospora viridis TaxID=281105 RepID=A0A561UC14_9ACTN|nr:hypothetical protein [Kitasatospora viridis]TWF96900.1 hypothetical protein FHX73_11674 [Kitasatospora viridis]